MCECNLCSSCQSPRSAGIIKEQLITHNPLWARCLLCWSGQNVCICVFMCQYLPPFVAASYFHACFLYSLPRFSCFLSSDVGSCCFFSSICDAPPLPPFFFCLCLMREQIENLLPTNLCSSLPLYSSLPLTLSFRLAGIQRHSELTCCSLHNTKTSSPTFSPSHFKVLYRKKKYTVFVCVHACYMFRCDSSLWKWQFSSDLRQNETVL